MRTTAVLLRLAACSLLLVSVERCGSATSGGTTHGAPSSGVVGTTGGTVASSDGVLSVSVPAGALPSNVTITVTPESSPASGAIGTVYDIGPEGTAFTSPVTMTFHYGSVTLGSTAATDLRAATYAGSSWQILSGASLNATEQTVSGTTMHLSPYAIIAVSSGATCATVNMTESCAGTGGGTIGSGSTSGSGTGGSTSGSTGTCGGAPTCATATNVCAGYPGSTMTGCTDNANGYTASCCFAPSAPICVALGGSETCSGSSGGGGGGVSGSSSGVSSSGSTGTGSTSGSTGSSSGSSSGTTSGSSSGTCTSLTCAQASCSGYPNAKLTGCTDSASGFTASCCWDPGTPVCYSMGAGGSCGSTGSSGGSGGTCTLPTCAEATCGSGATLQSCTATSDGYTASCCYPAGVLPGSGGGVSGGTVSSGGGSSTGSGSSGGTTSGGTGTGSTSGGTGGSTGTGSSGGSGDAG